MKSYKSRKLPYIETEKNIINKNSPKKFLLLSEKIKDTTTTPSRIPSCVSTSQEYQIENKFPKSKSSQKNNKPKNDFIIFKNYFNDKNANIQKSKDPKNNVKKTLSVDKIGKNSNLNNTKNNNNTKSFIENNLYKKENVKNEMNEIIQNFVDNNLQNSKNCNFFRLFKMKRKNQNGNKEDIFPPLYGNCQPLGTEQNVFDRYNNNGNKYVNLLTKPNEEKTNHYRDTLINSINKNKNKLKENKIFIKIDEHFNKLKNDKSPKMIKKGFQGAIKNIKSSNLNNNINNLINISANSKNIKNNNNENIPNFKSLITDKDKDIDKKSKEIKLENNINENIRTPSCEDKLKNNYQKKNKNRIKIKIKTPNSNHIYANKEDFDFLKNKERANSKRKNTPNIIINNIANTLQIHNHNKKNKITFGFDTNKIKNKKIEKVDDNILGDSFREELNIIISDVIGKKEKKIEEIEVNKKKDDSIDDGDDEIKLNLNYNDDSIEKNIPKEHEERINLIKKFNRPETSYGKKNI